MIQALEARRRSTSQIRPEIAARSPERAKAVRGAPLLQRFRRRHALGVDGVDQFKWPRKAAQRGVIQNLQFGVVKRLRQISSRIRSAK